MSGQDRSAGSGAPPAGGTPRLLRAHNERTLLEHLRAAGPSSRPGLARIAGLSKPTVSQALANLERAGLVRTVGPASPSLGRTAMLYEVDPTAGYVVGIDIGRAWIRVAAADLAGEIVARRDERNRARSAAALVKSVGEVAHDVVAAAGLTWQRVAHTVVGGPGVFDPDSDRLRHAPNVPGWSRPGVMSALREALPPTVTLDNDANLAAVGERTYGSGRDARTFVYVSVGTGIGMGVIIDGELYRGAHGAAGEVGYLPLGGDEQGAPAGGRDAKRRGMLEEAASADAVVRTAKRLGMAGATSAKRVFAAARGGRRAGAGGGRDRGEPAGAGRRHGRRDRRPRVRAARRGDRQQHRPAAPAARAPPRRADTAGTAGRGGRAGPRRDRPRRRRERPRHRPRPRLRRARRLRAQAA